MTQLEMIHDATATALTYSTDSYSRSSAKIGEFDDGLSTFLNVRRKLFAIAFRMLRSAAEAEDIVQEVWLRWQTTNRSVVLDPPAFLVTITTRMCINLCRSARARRETYIDSWLSEPADTSDDPCRDAEQKEALKSGVRILLERLRPSERAAYVLREAFNYSSRQIADVLQIKEANVRQLLTRARIHMATGCRARSSSAERRHLLTTFIDAVQNGNLATLEGVLASAIHSDMVSKNDEVSCLDGSDSRLQRFRSKQRQRHEEAQSSSRCLLQEYGLFAQQAPPATNSTTACLA